MTSQQIEYILTLAQLRSFSKAAQKLYVTQPSLSQFILSVEKQLGTPLFDRSTNPIKLTQAGEAYVKTAEKVKALEDSLKNELSDLANIKKGSLKIGASSFRASCLLAKSIAKFSNTYHGISITITEDNIDRLLALIKNGELDVCVGTGHFDTKYFHTEELATERLYLAIPVNHPLNSLLEPSRLSYEDVRNSSMRYLCANPIELRQIQNYPLICAQSGEFGEDRIRELCQSAGFSPNITLTAKTLETAFSLVTAGLGITFVPDTLIRFGNYANHPYYYPMEDSVSTNQISLISKKNGYYSNAALSYSLILKQLVDIGTWRV